MCCHAEFGRSISNHVRIVRGEAAKLASARATLTWDGVVADRLKTSRSPCAITPNLIVLL